MNNICYINEDRVLSYLADLTKDSVPEVQQWFARVIPRYFTKLIQNSDHLGYAPPPETPAKKKSSDIGRVTKAELALKYETVLKQVGPVPCTLNGPDEKYDRTWSQLSDDQRTALTKGAMLMSLKMSPALVATLTHVRDYLDWYVETHPKKRVDAIRVEHLPEMLAAFDMIKIEEQQQTRLARSYKLMHTANNGLEVVLIGTVEGAVQVGHDLQNCLRTNAKHYLRSYVLIGIRAPRADNDRSRFIASGALKMTQFVRMRDDDTEPKLLSNVAAVQEFVGGPRNAEASIDAALALAEYLRASGITLDRQDMPEDDEAMLALLRNYVTFASRPGQPRPARDEYGDEDDEDDGGDDDEDYDADDEDDEDDEGDDF